ncbi:MAG: STM4504/CBY_0614 family protein [Terracidiphilus sp.]
MELYSKRKRAAENPPASYRYDLPQSFKNQVLHIWQSSIGFINSDQRGSLAYNISSDSRRVDQIFWVYGRMNQLLCEEHGLIGLPGDGPCRALFEWFTTADTDTALDIIEASFQIARAAQNDHDFMLWVRPQLKEADATARLNQRFQEHAIGYRLQSGRIVRMDSEFLHTEATEPAFRLLYQHGYEGALEEFRLAHKQYREGPETYDDSLTNCLKSLESTLKTICKRRKWAYKEHDTASKLLDLAFSKELIPGYLQSHFSALRTTLDSGVPTIRNREGGHGSGEKPNDVPEYLTAYQLHLTASAIVFLIQANEHYGRAKP